MKADLRTTPDAGPELRGRTRLALVAALVLFGVEAKEPFAALIVGALFVPTGSRVFAALRRANPLFWSVPLAALLTWICFFRGTDWIASERGLGLMAGLLLAVGFLRPRLVPSDHLRLLAAGVLPVVLGALAPDFFFLPLLALWLLASLVAVSAAQARFEEERVLDAARIRGAARATAEEVGGRSPETFAEIRRGVAKLSFLALAFGVLLAWIVPRVVDAIGAAFAPVEVARPVLPPVEIAPDGTPLFSIPDEEACSMPFGPRLTREAFLRRLASDGLTLLLRPVKGSPASGGSLLVRGECYDTLTADGRWIRARAFERTVWDAEDGAADRSVAVGPGESFVGEYVVPRGLDRILYAVVDPSAFRDSPCVVRDGTGNVFCPGPTAPPRSYTVSSEGRRWTREPLADPGPEFLLVPEELRGLSLPDASLAEGASDSGAVEGIVLAMRGRYVHLERDAAPGEVEESAPDRLDPAGFLGVRRWGRNIDFATAFAVVLRNAGVPCRLATGYREGFWIEEGGFYAFEALHTFAWVEVPVEDAGWVALDPTPAALDDLGEERLAEVFEQEPEERSAEAARTVGDGEEPPAWRKWAWALETFLLSLLPAGLREGWGGRALVWIVMLGLGAVFLRFVLAAGERGVRILRRAAGRRMDGEPMPAFFALLVAALRRHGLRRRRAETPMEFARAAFASLGPDFEAVRDLTAAFCGVRYGQARLAPERERALDESAARVEEALSSRREGRSRGRGIARTLALLALAAVLAGAGPAEDLLAGLGDQDPAVRRASREALIAGGAESLRALVDEVSGARTAAEEREIAALAAALDADDFATREKAERALVAKGRAAVRALEAARDSSSPEARRRAARALAEIAELPPETPEAEAARGRRRRQALWLLGVLGGAAEAEVTVAAGLADRDLATVAREALAAIAARAPEAVLDLAARGDEAARALALAALGRSGAETVRPGLLALSTDPDPRTRAPAGAALLSVADVLETDRARELAVDGEAEAAESLLRQVLGRCPGVSGGGKAPLGPARGRRPAGRGPRGARRDLARPGRGRGPGRRRPPGGRSPRRSRGPSGGGTVGDAGPDGPPHRVGGGLARCLSAPRAVRAGPRKGGGGGVPRPRRAVGLRRPDPRRVPR